MPGRRGRSGLASSIGTPLVAATLALATTHCSGARPRATGPARANAPSAFHLEMYVTDGRPGSVTHVVVDGDRSTYVGRRGDAAGIFQSAVLPADREEAKRLLFGVSPAQPALHRPLGDPEPRALRVDSAATGFVLDADGRHVDLLFGAHAPAPPGLMALIGRWTDHPVPLRAFRIALADLPHTVDAGDTVTASVVIESVGSESMQLSLTGDFFVNGMAESTTTPGRTSPPGKSWRLGDVHAPSVPKLDRGDRDALREPAVFDLEPGDRRAFEVELRFPEPGRVRASMHWDGSFTIVGGGETETAYAMLDGGGDVVDVEP